ncbi:hypothetical protein JW933_07740 [candidate division FCPU426 bacterium]|nr:hypothetical protein [candidate division FCPU426 bacterium]
MEKTLVGISASCSRLGIPYMVIGGMANVLWGEPRATLDVDITVWVENDRIPDTVAALRRDYASRTPRPEDFIRETRVLPLQTPENICIDMIFAILPYEKKAIQRAVQKEVSGKPVYFCTAEDLILYKIISDRPKDLDDARQITRRQKGKLDSAYLEPLLKELSIALAKPGIWNNWLEWNT